MGYLKYVAMMLLAAVLTACGGGGGSAGTSSGGGSSGSSGGGTTTSTAPKLTLEILDSAGTPSTSISSTSTYSVKATLKTSAGAAVPNTIVTLSDDQAWLTFRDAKGFPLTAATVVTDSSGVAIAYPTPVSTSNSGGSQISASATVNSVSTSIKTPYTMIPSASGGTSSATYKLRLELRTADLGGGSSTNSIDSAGVYATATILDANNLPVDKAILTFSASGSVIFPKGSSTLSAATGIGTVFIQPSSGATPGAGTITVNASVVSASSTAITPVSAPFQIIVSTTAGQPTMTIQLLDATGASTNSVSATGVSSAVATVQVGTTPVANKVVTFSGSASLISLVPSSGTVLTDALGKATIQLNSASLTAAGAGTLTATTAVNGTPLTASLDYQLSVASLGLNTLQTGAGPLAAYGNRAVSVTATINGSPATTTPVQVTFTASCGTVSPSVVSTDSSGVASTTYTASNANCSGKTTTLNATAGSKTVSGTIDVSAAVATNVQFVSAAPTLIYLKDSVGKTQSQVTFKVVDSSGNPLQNQVLKMSLINTNAAQGITLNTLGVTTPVNITTDASGLGSVAVFSGTVPASVQVKAVLLDASSNETSIFTTSNVLTVASGRPVQKATSLAVSTVNIEGLGYDGVETNLTMYLADRQGNPVPDGTTVNFVATTGAGALIPPSCTVAGGSSSCSVKYRSSGTRPANGLVAILAYTPGEEDFVDLNRNNVYDAGEPFTDLGNAYRDDTLTQVGGVVTHNGTQDPGEFVLPRNGSSVCNNYTGTVAGVLTTAPNSGGINGAPDTCDGVWGTVDVRAQAVILLSGSFATTMSNTTPFTSGFNVTLSDVNGNAMPAGTSFSVSKLSTSTTPCAVSSFTPGTVQNSYGPTTVQINLSNCAANEVIGVQVTTPKQNVTGPYRFTLQ